MRPIRTNPAFAQTLKTSNFIAASACSSNARAQFCFKFRRIPCALGRTQRDAHERAGTTTTRSYCTESSHNKLLGFSQTSTSASGTASTSVTHQYDAAGNLQSDGLHQYHYDSQGRLQSARTGQGEDAPTTRYAHNALGQRVFKTEPLYAAASSKGAPTDSLLDDEEEDPGLLQILRDFFTRLWSPSKSDAEHLGWAYVYDEDGSLLGEYGMGGAQSAGQSQYIYLPTAQGPIPIAAEIDNRLYAIHTDHLGTPRRLTQADGQAAWQWAYPPYGDEAPTLGAKRFTNETTNPTTGATNIAPVRFNLRYPGQYFDAESGLHYNYFRSYDPRTGRYTQTDPIGLDGGWNRYSYVGGNPLSFVDPDGLQVRQAPPSITYSGGLAAARVQTLLSQIRQYNPSYSYQTVRPTTGPGNGYNNADVSSLTGILRGYQNAQVCTRNGVSIGRFITDSNGNVMLEPVGGSTVPYGRSGVDTHTLFPNGSNYQRLNPNGHPNNPTPHGHGHQMGTGTGRAGQGPSVDVNGNVVPANSGAAHWPLN